ncbi:MAG: allantoate amidohydrolase [Nocardioides sp.]|nr:allantoate amidohydrolase [Nocardioides sp.]
MNEILARCAELTRISASPHHLERAYLTKEHQEANDLVAEWMSAAGLAVRVDAVGNLVGRLGPADAPALVLGSHLDTVPDAGAYDGMLGVVLAIAAASRLRSASLPFALEVYGFSDEEGSRFGKALLGSSGASGQWDPAWWSLSDAAGMTLRQAFVDFGLDPEHVADAARSPEDLVGYLEAHIEQGPELEAADRSLGYVTSIAGARRFVVSVIGEARHAGGTPYPRRRDALVGAAEAVSLVERSARRTWKCAGQGVIATVGQLSVSPGAVNVIPGRADFSVDVRAATDAERDAAWTQMVDGISAICTERGLRLEVEEVHSAGAAPCAPWLQSAVQAGIAATDDVGASEPMGLWSRAGHDAMAMAAVTDIGMLFVRCHDGISHHPAESVREVDVARALDALTAAVMAVADTWSTA